MNGGSKISFEKWAEIASGYEKNCVVCHL